MQWFVLFMLSVAVFPDASENEWHAGEPFNVPVPVVEAIESCQWRGRSHIVNTDRVRYYLDGAHTPKSMEVCWLWPKSSCLVTEEILSDHHFLFSLMITLLKAMICCWTAG